MDGGTWGCHGPPRPLVWLAIAASAIGIFGSLAILLFWPELFEAFHGVNGTPVGPWGSHP